ncbi:hypothetical protein WR25_25775 [Diploscapter pachys]|uniref:Uncharacterized protein n=1 Tax=Diploscapter pachys TaxID=2018661 RepID=A0A2A2JWQ7_9BILA|nr:hypothetical protein WR25_25775 [Diploscapter pachys]
MLGVVIPGVGSIRRPSSVQTHHIAPPVIPALSRDPASSSAPAGNSGTPDQVRGRRPHDQPRLQQRRIGWLVRDPAQQRVDQHLARLAIILRDRGKRRLRRRRGGNVVEADDRHILGHPPSGLGQCAHRAQRDQVGCGEQRVERQVARQQSLRRVIARLLDRQRIGVQARIDRQPRRAQRRAQPAIPVAELGIMIVGITDETDPRGAARDQMLARHPPAGDIVAADRHPDRMRVDRSPAHEMRALRHQRLQPRLVQFVIAIAEQDDPVRLATVLVIGVPVGGELLERGEQVIPPRRAGAQDRPQHGEEEGVDEAAVVQRVFEEEQGQRHTLPPPQRRCVLVDLVVQLPRDRLDPHPRRAADRAVATQRAADRRLRYAGERGDVERGRRLVARARSPSSALHGHAGL